MCFVCTGCGKCKGGANLIRFVKCPACGKPVEVGDTSCPTCGASIEYPPLPAESAIQQKTCS